MMTTEEKKGTIKNSGHENNQARTAAMQDQSDETDERNRAYAAEVSVLRDQLLRKAAEFENYKRRTEAETERMMENAARHLIEDLLPVLDDFDRLLKSANEGARIEAIRDGCSLIAAKLNKVLSIRGLETFESEGQPFDVNFHDALLQVAHSTLPPNTVVEEVSKGYRLNDRVIRHAKVVVSADDEPAPSETTPAKTDSQE